MGVTGDYSCSPGTNKARDQVVVSDQSPSERAVGVGAALRRRQSTRTAVRRVPPGRASRIGFPFLAPAVEDVGDLVDFLIKETTFF